ncbi:MAG: hypothetical protein HY720_24415 [Planctomycetes bacterium]|nr:hypothetical protein [Planctomycetota bacterium]
MTHPTLPARPHAYFLARNLERLLGALATALAAALFLVFFERAVPASRGFLGLSAWFWVAIPATYGAAMLVLGAVTGVGHYAGWKKALAALDVALVGVAVYATGGPLSPLAVLFFVQAGAFAIAAGRAPGPARDWPLERAIPLDFLWYFPALAFAWYVPARAWYAHWHESAGLPGAAYAAIAAGELAGATGLAWFVRAAARVVTRRMAEDLETRNQAELAMRLAAVESDRDARSERDLSRAEEEREVLNWVNLTAGLTHSIGNEIHAIDHYAGVVLDYLRKEHTDVPSDICEKVEFIHDTNKARFGFVNFLQEFAENMKSSRGARPVPRNLKTIQLEDLIRDVREKVGKFESRELDPGDTDHQVQRQLAKNLHLQVIAKFEPPEKKSVTKGRLPVLDFVLYEFLKNALRNCSGQRLLKAMVETQGEWVTIRLINDLNVETRKPPPGKPGLGCSLCKRIVPELYWLANSDYLDAFCDECLRRKVEANLQECWEPGRTSQGGKGLGLFVIRYFLKKYYFGRTECGVINWESREVYFQVTIPDDLEEAIRRHNARYESRPMKKVAPTFPGAQETP